MWYPDYQNSKPLCGNLIINLGKNGICVCYCKQMKRSLQESKKNAKYVLAMYVLASMSNYIYLLRQG